MLLHVLQYGRVARTTLLEGTEIVYNLAFASPSLGRLDKVLRSEFNVMGPLTHFYLMWMNSHPMDLAPMSQSDNRDGCLYSSVESILSDDLNASVHRGKYVWTTKLRRGGYHHDRKA